MEKSFQLEGGVEMNKELSQMQIRQKIDSYCKKVINNAAMDGHRTFGRIQKNECSLDEISLEDIESLYYFDTYPSDLNVFMCRPSVAACVP